MSDSPDFSDTTSGATTAANTGNLDVPLADLLAQLSGITINTAGIAGTVLSVEMPLRFSGGKPLFVEQWEFGIGKWQLTSSGAGASCARITTDDHSKGACLKMVGGSTLAKCARARMVLGALPLGKYGLQCALAFHADVSYTLCQVYPNYKERAFAVGVLVDVANGLVKVMDETYTYVTVIPVLPVYLANHCYAFLKLTFDLDTLKYGRLYFNEYDVDISTIGIYESTAVAGDPVEIDISIWSAGATSPACYLDDIVLTEEA